MPTSDIQKSTTTEHTAITFLLLLTTPLDQSRGAQNNLLKFKGSWAFEILLNRRKCGRNRDLSIDTTSPSPHFHPLEIYFIVEKCVYTKINHTRIF
jgi:hypothetical protein